MRFDSAIGSEIRKTRPAIVVSNDAANRNLSRVVVVPLSSHVDRLYPSEALVSVEGQRSKAMADQVMTADKSRLEARMGAVSREDLAALEAVIALHLGMRW